MTEQIRPESRRKIGALIKQHWRSPLDAQRLVKAAALRQHAEQLRAAQQRREERSTVADVDLDLEEEDDELDAEDDDKGQSAWKKLADDPELAKTLLRAVEGIVPDILKRSLFAGVGNVLLSEEGLKAMLLEKNIPKEVVNLLLSQADVMRREILRIISREIRIFLENMDFGGEISKILTSLSFEVKTEIRFIPNDHAVRPSIKNKVQVKRAQGEDEESSSLGDEDSSPHEAEPKTPGAGANKKRRWALRRRDEDGSAPSSHEDED